MTCAGINPGNAYLWLAVGGILFGGGLRFIIAPKRRRRPAGGTVILSLSVLSILASLFLTDFSLEQMQFRLYWLGSCILLGYIGFMFWKLVGIPLILVFVIALSLIWYTFSDWRCTGPGAEICSFTTISEGEDFIRVNYECSNGSSGVSKVNAGRIIPSIDIIELPDYFFILKSSSIYKLYGFSGSSEKTESRVVDLMLLLPETSLSRPVDAFLTLPSVEYKMLFGRNNSVEIKKYIE